VTVASPRLSDARLVKVGNRTLRIRVEGSGPGLLLLNGLTRPLESWEPFVAALSSRTIVSFDAPGIGESPEPVVPLSIKMLATVAASVLDEVGLDRVDVLGISHGGAVAQQFAVTYPGRLNRLVLVATSCGVGSTLGNWRALNDLTTESGAGAWPEVASALWHSMAVACWSSLPFLGAISAPTLVICGIEDTVTPLANSRMLARRIPNASLITVPGGHDLQDPQSADSLAHVVDNFLEGVL
jgi:pimeloyl-ACP methyl ester carboxylesterase